MKATFTAVVLAFALFAMHLIVDDGAIACRDRHSRAGALGDRPFHALRSGARDVGPRLVQRVWKPKHHASPPPAPPSVARPELYVIVTTTLVSSQLVSQRVLGSDARAPPVS